MKSAFFQLISILIISTGMASACHSTKKISQSKYTILTGNILNYEGEAFKFTYDTYGLLEGTRSKQIKIDSKGNFYLKMELDHPIKGDLYFGREMFKGRGINKHIYIYLNPGDSLYVTADVKVLPDTDRIEKTLRFSGTAKNDNEFVNRFDFRFNAYDLLRQNNSTFIKELHPDEYKRTVDSVRDSKLKFINDYADSVKISPKLKGIYESETINLAEVRKFNYPSSHAYFNEGKEAVLPGNYYDFVQNIRIPDDLEDRGVPYLRSLHFFLQHMYALQQEAGYDKDYLSFINGQLKGRAKYIYMAYSLRSDFNAAIYNQFGENCPYPDINQIVKSRYSYMEKMLPGKPAPDFFLVNNQGETLASSTLYKGQLIYIDFWATWCKPCIREFPFVAELEKEYKDKNIRFISLSFDDDKSDWVSYLAKNTLKDGQFWVDSKSKAAIKQTFNINMIPRFVLLDGKGNIINANAPRPSSGEDVRKLINNALGKN